MVKGFHISGSEKKMGRHLPTPSPTLECRKEYVALKTNLAPVKQFGASVSIASMRCLGAALYEPVIVVFPR